MPIIVTNIVGGLLYGIGWIVAIVWCFIEPKKSALLSETSIADELEKLHALKERGILTADEFELKKQDLLNSK